MASSTRKQSHHQTLMAPGALFRRRVPCPSLTMLVNQELALDNNITPDKTLKEALTHT